MHKIVILTMNYKIEKTKRRWWWQPALIIEELTFGMSLNKFRLETKNSDLTQFNFCKAGESLLAYGTSEAYTEAIEAKGLVFDKLKHVYSNKVDVTLDIKKLDELLLEGKDLDVKLVGNVIQLELNKVKFSDLEKRNKVSLARSRRKEDKILSNLPDLRLENLAAAKKKHNEC